MQISITDLVFVILEKKRYVGKIHVHVTIGSLTNQGK